MQAKRVRISFFLCIFLGTIAACGKSTTVPTISEQTPPPSAKSSPEITCTSGSAITYPPVTPLAAGIVTGHPRLWVRAEDLPRLRALANGCNPYYRDGLAVLAETAKQNMDSGNVPGQDTGVASWVEYPTEEHALLFAFMSLIHPDASEREAYAARARKLLMFVMNEAAKGPAEGKPFRDLSFSWNDRSRWNGRSFGLTVDWIYPSLSASDKATIRKVFLRWSEELRTEGRYRPEPVGRTNDPAMLADLRLVRYSVNNYATAGMRNMGYMAMALDPADDPDNKLHDYLKDAIGARLYLIDHMLKTDARGGLSPEGFEYSPQALGYVVEFLLALNTAGQADPAKWGSQVSSLVDNSFWNDSIPAFLNSLSPAKFAFTGDLSYLGEVFQPAWYGSGSNYWAPDMIELYGPLGIYDQLTGNLQQLEKLRWVETYTPLGGKEKLLPKRIGNPDNFGTAIEYYLLYDPAAAEPADPRLSLPLDYFAEGTGRLLARTSWKPDATWFDYALGWNMIDHQTMDGNTFELYRKGEWLTMRRVGYDYDYALSDNQNTMAIQNDKPGREDYRLFIWERGSQWPYNDAQPKILSRIVTEKYVYVTGDATSLYNSAYEQLNSVSQAVRSIVWLKGDGASNDVIVVYDRTATARPDQFKRFWLNLPAELKVQGQSGVMATASGQQLFLNSLLPAGAQLSVNPAVNEPSDEPAVGDNTKYKLKVEPSSPAQEVKFLTVLQGADKGASAYPVALVESQAGTAYQGAVVGKTAVLFPVQVSEALKELKYQVPGNVSWQLIAGLEPEAGYDVTIEQAGENLQVTVRPGKTYQADAAGMLSLEAMPKS